MRTGMTICERYRLERRLGSGGQASVWRCQDLVTGREVALLLLELLFQWLKVKWKLNLLLQVQTKAH